MATKPKARRKPPPKLVAKPKRQAKPPDSILSRIEKASVITKNYGKAGL